MRLGNAGEGFDAVGSDGIVAVKEIEVVARGIARACVSCGRKPPVFLVAYKSELNPAVVAFQTLPHCGHAVVGSGVVDKDTFHVAPPCLGYDRINTTPDISVDIVDGYDD